jgi:hypothetical protein
MHMLTSWHMSLCSSTDTKTTHRQWLNEGILKHEETGTVTTDEMNKVTHFIVVIAFNYHKTGKWAAQDQGTSAEMQRNSIK